jgi:hypothetical protein
MKHWKPIAAGIAICTLAVGAYAVRNRLLNHEMIVVPAGTKIEVRLDHGISTDKNSPGDSIAASLNAPLVIDGKTLAPVGSKVIGQLTSVKESGRIRGRANLTMVLQELQVGENQYELSTNPITLVAPGTKKRDAEIIGGSAAAGSAIGAIAGGGVGAAIGAGIGAGSGSGVVLATKGKDLSYGPEARFTFTLSEPIRLPVFAS